VPRLNDSVGRGGWRLENVTVSERSLKGVVLSGATFVDVLFEKVNLQNAVFAGCTFERVEFSDCVLTGSKIKQLQATESAFKGCQMAGASLLTCSFAGTSFERLRAPDIIVEDCSLVGGKITTAGVRQARIMRCRFQGLKIDDVVATDARTEECELVACEVEAVSIFGGGARAVSMTGGKLSKSGFLDSSAYNITFTNVQIKGLTLNSAEGSNVAFVDCPGMTSCVVAASTVDGLSITGCQALVDFFMFESTIKKLRIVRCKAALLRCINCDVSGPGEVDASLLDGADLSQSRISQLAIKGTTIAKRLSVSDALFTGLKLSKNTLEPGINLESLRTTYRESDRFGP
jgi:uncharacterized protein YjbI with pentapeptide repeats